MSFFSRFRQASPVGSDEKQERTVPKWSMGVLNDKRTIEVPGSVLLLAQDRNEPLGLRNAPARMSHSSMPVDPPIMEELERSSPEAAKKKTPDGRIILEPQPDDSENDPLNWPSWRRDSALLCLGFYCMVGGGMTTILAAGFTDVAEDYDVGVGSVALTTGLFMMGLGIGSMVASPTAILYGKRVVYLVSAVIFAVTSVWCAVSPSFPSLIVARIFQGISISPVECLPSATIAEIFFLHERAFRIGIYTLLLLGGKNLVPLVSAVVIENLGWRWVFWVVAMVVGFCWVLLFLFVPETTWDRTPVPKSRRPTTPRGPSLLRRLSSLRGTGLGAGRPPRSEPQLLDQTPVDVPHSLSTPVVGAEHQSAADDITPFAGSSKDGAQERGVSGSPEHPQTAEGSQGHPHVTTSTLLEPEEGNGKTSPQSTDDTTSSSEEETSGNSAESDLAQQSTTKASEQKDNGDSNDDDAGGPSSPPTTAAKDGKTISQTHSSDAAQTTNETFQHLGAAEAGAATHGDGQMPLSRRSSTRFEPTTAQGQKKSKGWRGVAAIGRGGGNDDGKKEKRKEDESVANYTNKLRNTPRRTFVQQLRPYYGRMHRDNWFKVAVRPLILYSYPSVLWSSVVYACSVGWLIVVSESVAVVYRNKDTYNFNAFQTGLVYLSPFVGGVLGTAVAGKVSDIVIKFMASRNGGLYEPEFRIVMALPVALSTVAGLMGFGWSAEKGDHWIVPTIFLGIISFGCTLGSTTAITFCVDSYRQYAGEALVTLNVSKNIFHGLVFSFFVTDWIEHSGPKEVYIWLGVIQLILLTFSIPMYIYGKRARMWTVRKNFMEKF